ncbi:hypothetical protein [Curtobacterium sp. MCSS17_016]|uniref:hypothetical protein n=1 Tax=Curtobacterium sp. MCSS17_016 TaxID=2175644 RepID=UPI000DA888DD|nr:hypothetical protein [Curtobacterium sp. MCSS17_016]WIE81397.1 hypothetical protein DEJ19_019370 [Curtobacterium sp. MCSS17_016]
MDHTIDTIRAAFADIDIQQENAFEFGRVAAELRRGTAVIIGRQVGAGVRGRSGARLNAGPPLSKELTAVAAAELASYAETNQNVAVTTNAAIAYGASVSATRSLIAAADHATGQANLAAVLLRHLRPTFTDRVLAVVLPGRRRYRATDAETKVMQHVLETLAHRHRDAAAAAAEALGPAEELRPARS